MRTLLTLAVVLALFATAAAQEDPLAPEQPPMQPDEGAVEEPPFTPGDEQAPPAEQQPGEGVTPIEQEQQVDVEGAPFGLAWWGWLLIALIIVGLIAAIAVAMGAREPRETIVERDYRRPPP